MSFDIDGAAALCEERARRWAPLMAAPDMQACVGLLARNPQIARAARHAIEAEVAKLPDGRGLDSPLFQPPRADSAGE